MRLLLLFMAFPLACRSGPATWAPDLTIAWEKNMLSISGPDLPGGTVKVWYLEAYCRSASTDREWKQTTIPHKTELVSQSEDGRRIALRCAVEGGVEVSHVITASRGGVAFEVEAVNRGTAYLDAVWVQPCIRVEKFTGAGKETYIPKCFIFVDGERRFLDRCRRTEEAIYKGGQVYVPAGIDRKDVNPRPLSPDVPSNGLMGCVSADGRYLFATAWEPYQELFQGVITCIHSDFRLGGLQPGEKKRAKGRIYVMENDVDHLLASYRADFGG